MALDSDVIRKLICPKCRENVSARSASELICTGCSSIYNIENGVVDLLVNKSMKTKLENIDYDAVGGISEKAIENIGVAWTTVFDNAGLDLNNKSVLEIGSGTGALTLGLLKQTQAAQIFATDISEKFLSKSAGSGWTDPSTNSSKMRLQRYADTRWQL